MKICFGIPSWLPDKEPDRSLRIERINRLFKQLNDLWPDIDILVIAQNWRDFEPIETTNKQAIKKYPELGILIARKKLREEFLRLKYDYIIMFDDDAIIKCSNNHVHLDYIAELEKHPQGFCFIHGGCNHYHPYIGAQLNLCAISRFIYEREPMVDVDPQKKEGFEDSIFACLLHYKYSKYEFNPPEGIKPIQFNNPNEKAPSTWHGEARKTGGLGVMRENTSKLQKYISEHKDLPKNYKEMLVIHKPISNKTVDGRRNGCYLYF